ncbi:hypothetical protein AURDEDRAFT_170462 [Auricularia subglabra TFB-10046 SS5]|nr:hypothetical protein AURDEDRAFT_170462 [Auricularia subglabra TFB-10046 SS5]
MSAHPQPDLPTLSAPQAPVGEDGGTLPAVVAAVPAAAQDINANEALSVPDTVDTPDVPLTHAPVIPREIVPLAAVSEPGVLPDQHPPGVNPTNDAGKASEADAALDRYVRKLVEDLCVQAQDLRHYSRRMKHHKKACFALGDQAAALVASIEPPFNSALFIMHIATESKVLFEAINDLFHGIERSYFLNRWQRSNLVDNELKDKGVALQSLHNVLKHQ